MAKRESEGASSAMWSSRTHPVREDMSFQQAEWRGERVGWGILCLLAVLACLGLFSAGPLSWSTATDGTGRLHVGLERFHRNGASATMQLDVEAGPGTETRIFLGSAFMEAFTVETMRPEPVDTQAVPGGLELRFGRAENAPLSVYLAVRPEAIGPVRSEIGLAGGEPARFVQFIYP